MLHPDWLMSQLDELTVLYSDLHTDILKTIAKHLSDTLRATGQLGLMPSTKKLIETAQTTGLRIEDIEKFLDKKFNLHIDVNNMMRATVTASQMAMRELFEDASVESLRWDNEVYREAGLPEVVVRQSPTLNGLLEAGINKQIGQLARLTGTIAINSEELFERTLNTAYNKVIAGTHSYTEALRTGIDEMVAIGVGIFIYESGRRISIESALLTNIRTGVSQTAGQISHTAMLERNAPCCETSAHIGARDTGEGYQNHEQWQGKVFSLLGKTEEYDDFYVACGYGNVQGIYGANCRHSHRPFYPGITQRRWTPEKLKEYANTQYTFTGADGKQKTVDAYKAEQILRGTERQVREWKREIAIKQTANIDTSSEKKKLLYWQGRLRTFCEETGLRRQPIREQI